MMGLYEINGQYQQLLSEAMAEAEANEGVIPDDLSDRLDSIGLTREIKIENCIKYCKNEKAIAEMIDKEIAVLTLRAKTHWNSHEWMKRMLSATVTPGEKLEYSYGKISWRKSSAVEITVPIDELPEKYIKIEKSAMKAEIKDAINSGETVAGCHIANKLSIQVK